VCRRGWKGAEEIGEAKAGCELAPRLCMRWLSVKNV